ncbi:MAG: serine/threonine-protein kinase [Pseudomonadota bacterium]
MTGEAPPHDVGAALDQVFADLAANRPEAGIAAQLRSLEASCQAPLPIRARYLNARGLVMNRMGQRSEALGDLLESAALYAQIGDAAGAAQILRAIALVHAWRSDARESALALLRAISEASDDRVNVALSLFEAGRLEVEIGRPRDAYRFFERGLAIGAEAPPPLERDRARIGALQALVAARDIAAAQAAAADLNLDRLATPRLQHLARIERARIALAQSDFAVADSILAEIRAGLPADPEKFEHAEYAHAEAESLFARKSYPDALKTIGAVIARYADDNLPGREISARLLESQIFDALDRAEEADRTLAAALRRAVAANLPGHADTVRERLAARGRSQNVWAPGLSLASSNLSSADRFVRRKPLGAGGFGSVSRAYDLELGTEVALKNLRLKAIYDSAVLTERRRAAEMEVAAASRIQHPGVGRVYGLLDEPDGDALLARELVEGPTLREAMQTKLHLAEKIGLMAQLAHCLAAIHAAGIVHRDLKPENVVLRDGVSPVIIDFGISAIGHVWQSKDAPKTLNYAAPEQTKAGWADARSDIYAMGVIAYEILRGCLPPPAPMGLASVFDGRGKTIDGDLRAAGAPAAVAGLVAQMLAASPRRRPQAARDIALALQTALADIRTA